MGTTSTEIVGVMIHSPVDTATNLLLTVQCLVYYRQLTGQEGERARGWGLFFQMMSIATAAGVVKHGFRPELGAGAFTLVLAISNMAGGFATHSAQRATIVSRAEPRRWSILWSLTLVELGIFVAANLAVGPAITLLIANTAVGLGPVILVEARAFHNGSSAGGAVAGGLCLSIVAALAYLGGFSSSPWLDAIAVSHVLLGVSFALMHRGASGAPSVTRSLAPPLVDAAVERSSSREASWGA